MLLNGLGFVSAPLYPFSEFFEGKSVKHLLGAGGTAAHLNDDRLGQVLDQLFEYGTTLFGVADRRYDWPHPAGRASSASPTLLPKEKESKPLVPSPPGRGLGCSLLPAGWGISDGSYANSATPQ